MEFRALPAVEPHGCAYQLAVLDDLAQWPERAPWTSPYFKLFLAADADRIEPAAWQAFAERVLDQGLSYFCAWGPGCTLLDDAMDAAVLEHDLDDDRLVMTTWHARESLAEALWYFRFCAVDSDHEPEECNVGVVALLDHRQLAVDVEPAMLAS